ncbi:MAG: GNAT family N-acetyltransferase [Armatimonadetes bacterium]|nr:GNAT family N-acetyltransferase [Armatimonadota bacterium]
MIIEDQDAGSALAAPHYGTAFRILLERSRPAGYTPLASGGLMVITGLPHPLANMAIDPSADELEPCAKALGASGCPSMLVFTTHDATAFEAEVTRFGFSEPSKTPAMAVDLAELNQTAMPDGYTFHRLMPHQDARPWMRAAEESFQVPYAVCEILCSFEGESEGRPDDDVQFFMAMCEDEVVAVSALVLADGVAGMYCVGTLPDHRGKGLGAHLTAEPLRLARNLGYRVGVLQASKLGYPVYERLGFRTVASMRIATRMP